MNHLGAIVLAAGKGTRMQAPPDQNKVAFTLNQKPMISYTIDTLKQCQIHDITVVVGYAKESVMAILGDSVTYATQDNPQGTGHAVQVALKFTSPQTKHFLVMYGDDSAFYPSSLIQQLITTHQDHHNQASLITVDKPDPTGLGRILRDSNGQVIGIVEEKNASEKEKQITEINTGLYCFEADFLKEAIGKIQRNPVSQEYYLTDVIAYACDHHQQVEAILWPDSDIWYGVNTPEQLKTAELRMKQKNAVQ